MLECVDQLRLGARVKDQDERVLSLSTLFVSLAAASFCPFVCFIFFAFSPSFQPHGDLLSPEVRLSPSHFEFSDEHKHTRDSSLDASSRFDCPRNSRVEPRNDERESVTSARSSRPTRASANELTLAKAPPLPSWASVIRAAQKAIVQVFRAFAPKTTKRFGAERRQQSETFACDACECASEPRFDSS